MKKYIVSAYKDGSFSHWASGWYDTFPSAFEYCSKCIRECARKTGMKYHVEEVDV